MKSLEKSLNKIYENQDQHCSFIFSNNMHKNKLRILSINPGTRYMGFAFFDGIDLVDFGTRSIKQGSEEKVLKDVEEVIIRFLDEKQPHYIALKQVNFSQNTQNARSVRVAQRIKTVSDIRNCLIYKFSQNTIFKVICNDGNANNRRVAEVLITDYPELAIYLKAKEQTVLNYHMTMILAVAIGVTFIREHVSNVLPIRWSNRNLDD